MRRNGESPRALLVGCGNIAEFHVKALREAGFDVSTVTSRRGSVRLEDFARRHSIPRTLEGLDDLRSAWNEHDAAVIAATTEATPEILMSALRDGGRPVLVEKPISLCSADLRPFLGSTSHVLVAYNRRFYRPVAEARKEAAAGGPLVATLFLPESVRIPASVQSAPDYLRPFFENSVHGLDMARFVFGPLHIRHVQRLQDQTGVLSGFAAVLVSARGDVVQVTANFAAPSNFSLTLDRPGRRYELRPFEKATIFSGMEVVEPTPESPIRVYRPKVLSAVGLDPVDHAFKPGFVSQAKALAALVRGEDPRPAATLEDAYEALVLAEGLAGQTFPRAA